MKAKPNYKVLGSRMGAKMKSVALSITNLTPFEIEYIQTHDNYKLLLEHNDYVIITKNDIIVY